MGCLLSINFNWDLQSNTVELAKISSQPNSIERSVIEPLLNRSIT